MNWVCLWHKMWQWFHGYMLISKLIKLHTLSMDSFSYVSHTSIKLFFKKKTDRQKSTALRILNAIPVSCFHTQTMDSSLALSDKPSHPNQRLQGVKIDVLVKSQDKWDSVCGSQRAQEHPHPQSPLWISEGTPHHVAPNAHPGWTP